MDFREAERRYVEISQQLAAGTLSTKEFDEQLEKLKVQYPEGTWWAKGPEPKGWYYHDGSTWVRGVPANLRRTFRTMDYWEAERRYAEIKQQLDAGALSPEEFDERLEELKVQDAQGTWWAKSHNKSRRWYYHNGSTWVRGLPPDHQQELYRLSFIMIVIAVLITIILSTVFGEPVVTAFLFGVGMSVVGVSWILLELFGVL